MVNGKRKSQMIAGAQSMTEHDEVTAEIKRQQQIHLVNRLAMMAQVNAFNATITTIVVWAHVNHVVALLWLGLMYSGAAFQILSWRRLSRAPEPKRVSGRMLERARLHSLLAGALWGGTLILFRTPDNVGLEMFLGAIVAGMSSGTVMLLSPIPSINRYFLASSLGPLAVMFLIQGELFHIGAGVLAIMFAFTLNKASMKSYDTLADMVRSSLERGRARADLVDAIESTNDGFALLDSNKNVVEANLRFRTWFANVEDVADDPPEGRLRMVVGGRWVYSALRPTTRGGFVSVHVDVTELKRREQELLTAKLRAEAADRAKTQFLANMSHELRTPLNAVIGFSQIMKDELFGTIGDPRYRDYAADIEKSGTHLLAIINDILDLSKLESAAFKISPDEVEIAEAIKFAASVCERRPENAEGRKVELEIDKELPLLHVDPRALRQILINLIGNAVKFTPAEGRVGVRTQTFGAEWLDVVVWDEGIGIPEEKIETVLQPFAQVETDYARNYQGSGLGLAISDALMRLHEAELLIDSAEGAGTRVTLRFPRKLFLNDDGSQMDADGSDGAEAA